MHSYTGLKWSEGVYLELDDDPHGEIGIKPEDD